MTELSEPFPFVAVGAVDRHSAWPTATELGRGIADTVRRVLQEPMESTPPSRNFRLPVLTDLTIPRSSKAIAPKRWAQYHVAEMQHECEKVFLLLLEEYRERFSVPPHATRMNSDNIAAALMHLIQMGLCIVKGETSLPRVDEAMMLRILPAVGRCDAWTCASVEDKQFYFEDLALRTMWLSLSAGVAEEAVRRRMARAFLWPVIGINPDAICTHSPGLKLMAAPGDDDPRTQNVGRAERVASASAFSSSRFTTPHELANKCAWGFSKASERGAAAVLFEQCLRRYAATSRWAIGQHATDEDIATAATAVLAALVRPTQAEALTPKAVQQAEHQCRSIMRRRSEWRECVTSDRQSRFEELAILAVLLRGPVSIDARMNAASRDIAIHCIEDLLGLEVEGLLIGPDGLRFNIGSGIEPQGEQR